MVKRRMPITFGLACLVPPVRTRTRRARLLRGVPAQQGSAFFIVLFEDSAALAGILVAAAGTFLAARLHAPVFDGIASIVIGLLLAARRPSRTRK